MKRFPEHFRVEKGIWRPQGKEDTLPAEGDTPELSLEAALAGVSDLSSESQELALAVKDRATEHHLSPLRSNLLRVLDFRKEARVLELGCGSGGLTRCLGEAGGRVIAFEEQPALARLARIRCVDLGNVDIVAGSFDDVAFDEPFDIVLLAGILEDVAMHWRRPGDPREGILRFALESLASGGVLLLATENKLGMKYFSGCVEDHSSTPFHGIEGYPDRGGRRTLGRQELIDLARRAGFAEFELILPFPDWKLPTTFINARFASARECAEYNLVDWCREPFVDYRKERMHLFSDLLALSSVAATGLLADFSNSFLLLASAGSIGEGSPVRRPDWIARGINILRRPEYRTRTTLRLRDGDVVIPKERLAAVPPAPDAPLALSLEGIHPFVRGGRSLFMEMLRAIRRTSGAEKEFTRLVARWVDRLLEDRIPGTALLPPGHLDCLPSNLILDSGGELYYIDEEWHWSAPIPMDWVLFRGLMQFWRKNGPWIDRFLSRPDAEFEEFLERALAHCGVPIDGKRIDELADMEIAFHWATCPLPPPDLRAMRKRRGKRPPRKRAGKAA